MSTEATVPGVKNKALKVIVLVGGGIVVGMTAYALLDKYILKKYNIA